MLFRNLTRYLFLLVVLVCTAVSPALSAESQARISVDSERGDITAGNSFRFHRLVDIEKGESLYVLVEPLSDDLVPVVTLFNNAGEPLMTASPSEKIPGYTLKYSFKKRSAHSRLLVSGQKSDGTLSTGTYRVTVGLNAARVLEGATDKTGTPLFKRPNPVSIGVQMHQITELNQKSETFGVVATLLMEWEDPALAYVPGENEEPVRVFSGDGFAAFMDRERLVWPQFSIYNQQGNRWAQNRTAAISPDGKALYAERFTTTLQAPDFDFRRFPLDAQQFYIRVDNIFPEWYYVFRPMENFSKVGEQLGEEEWVITKFDTSIERTESAKRPVSRFNFRFEAKRHLNYYVLRMLFPILLIVSVSWIIFFMKDYDKRVEVAAGNLLLFIAFNFNISNDLPRLGYMTFIDALLFTGFVVTAFMLILSVFLKRMIMEERIDFVKKIDGWVISLYPLAYVLGTMIVFKLF